jgi:hypothetical protein
MSVAVVDYQANDKSKVKQARFMIVGDKCGMIES